MKYLYAFFFLFYCLCILVSESHAQNNKGSLITGDFQAITIEQLVEQLEKRTAYHFYYDTAQFDSLHIEMISVTDQPLSTVLQKAFENTVYNFSIYKNKQVFLTKGLMVKTELPENFYNKPVSGSQKLKTDTVTNFLEQGRNVLKATLENKIYEIGDKAAPKTMGNASVAGYVRDVKTGEPVIGASIFLENSRIGVATDQFGYYSFSLPKGRHVMNLQSIGMKDTKRQLMLYSDGKLDIELQTQVMTLKNVIVSAEKASNVKGLQMGLQKIDIKTIKQVPVVFGEADLLKVLLTLPGVKSVGEASTGLNVRGGSTDQNLILFNNATIYNPSHFFGMFSAFNPEVVKDVELYKSSIPARFGGRLSSVVDINSREGNKKDISGSAGIGVLTSRVNIEGPLVKDKSSFILGGRATYANWLLNLLPDQYKNSRAGFYDVNLNINHQVNEKNTIYFTGYLSKDRFNLNTDTVYNYGNRNVSFKWKHIFSNKMNSIVTTGYDQYTYNISSEKNPVNAYKMSFDINQAYLKVHFNYYLNTKNNVDFGLNSIYYKMHPGSYLPLGTKSLVAPDIMPAEQALESALYASDRYTITDDFSIEAGVRYSLYNYLGPKQVNNYAPGFPKTEANIIDKTSYHKGDFIKTYKGPEFRLSARYALSPNSSIKAGYNTQRQYIHMLSNTAAMAPTDVWKLSDPNVKPQYGDQVSVGFYQNFKSNTIETSVEVYYKNIKDYLDYKSGAVLVLNQHVETDVISTRGKAYGVELLVKKLTGKLNGWISRSE
ncbi:MAG: TonB-dependent receptor [Chitinophagaceae bacterium]